jgi:hypothetical protein
MTVVAAGSEWERSSSIFCCSQLWDLYCGLPTARPKCYNSATHFIIYTVLVCWKLTSIFVVGCMSDDRQCTWTLVIATTSCQFQAPNSHGLSPSVALRIEIKMFPHIFSCSIRFCAVVINLWHFIFLPSVLEVNKPVELNHNFWIVYVKSY